MKKAFTLIELLVVIAVIALLMGILVPSLCQARLLARIIVVNAELRQIAIALECYFYDNRKYPPTREDCHTGFLKDHLYQLPEQLAEGDYLPATSPDNVMATIMEDRFHPGHTYKYRCPGEVIRDRNLISEFIPARIWIPNRFPTYSSIDINEGRWYPNDDERQQYRKNYDLFPLRSPVTWTVFSLGPDFDEQWVLDTISNRYPVPKEIWYSPQQKKGFLVRLHLKNSREIGSFDGE